MSALRIAPLLALLYACGQAPAPAAEAPSSPPASASAPSPPVASSGDASDAGPSTGHVDAGVMAKIFDRVGELIAARIRTAAGAKYASRDEAQATLDKLLGDWTHVSGMSDILASLGVKASEVEAFIDQHPEVLKRQAARIAERMREPMLEFEEAMDKQFPRTKGK